MIKQNKIKFIKYIIISIGKNKCSLHYNIFFFFININSYSHYIENA